MITRILSLILVLLVSSCCFASEFSIHSMVVGDKVWELSGSRQLSTAAEGEVEWFAISPKGDRVAYITSTDDENSLHIIKADECKSTTIFSGPIEKPSTTVPTSKNVKWTPHGQIVWSPNGEYLALEASRYLWENGEWSEDQFLVVLEDTGKQKTLMPVAKNSLTSEIAFSPNSDQLAVGLNSEIGFARGKASVVLLNMDGSSETVFTTDNKYISLIRWDVETNDIILSTYELRPNSMQYLALSPTTGTVKPVDFEFIEGNLSPNRKLIAKESESGVTIDNLESGASAQVPHSKETEFICWLPNSTMILLSKETELVDLEKERSKELKQLWLVNLARTTQNTMCVAVDSDYWKTSWSADCTNMAYICNDHLYLAEIAEREPTGPEAQQAGLALDEEQVKELLMGNAKMIGIGIKMYCNDWEKYPDAQSVVEDVSRYLQSDDDDLQKEFLDPVTGKVIFKYLVPAGVTAHDVDDPSSFPLGEFDVGYSWKVVVYADGHVESVPKDQP